MKKLLILLFAIVLVFPVFLSAEETGGKTGAAVEESSETEGGGYVYDPGGRRDPFEPLVDIKKRKIEEKPHALGTLEGYDITDFRLLAIVDKSGRQNYGLLLSSDDKSFTVRIGTVIGLHDGRVKEIQPDKIVIEEYIEDYKGELRPRQVVLELRKEEGK